MTAARTLAIALTAGTLLALPVDAQTLRLATVVNEPHPWLDAAEVFKAHIEENSDLTVEIFPGGQLGNDATVVDEMRIGTVDVMISSVGNVASFVRPFEFFALNYLFSDMDAFRAATDPEGEIFAIFADIVAEADVGMHLLALTGGGTRNLSNARGPITSPDDMAGIRMRTTGAQLDADMWQAMGAVTSSLPWTELYTGVQTGVVTAFESTISGFVGSRLYEVASYHSLTEHQIMMSQISISELRWDALDEETRAVVMEAARLAGETGTEAGVRADEELLGQLAEQGVTITEVDREAFAARVADLHDALAERLGVSEVLTMIREMN